MPRPPNVVFVITDDQGYGDIGCHGNPVLQTPNLDYLANESVQLDDHHHDPLCSPSRAALMTGQYAARNGVWHVIQGRHLLDPHATTMADVFAQNGYRTAMFGKWHLGDNYPFAPRFRGFDEVLCHRGGGVGELPDYWGNSYVDDVYFRNGAPEPRSGYCTDVFFDAALDFIERNADQPFFVYLATNAMHSPFIVPEEYAAPYIDQGIPPRRSNFYGMIANFDENMGRLLALLNALGLDEETIIVFTSDHGTAAGWDEATGDGFNAGMRGVKGSVYEGGHRVSFFLRWKGELPRGRKLAGLTAHIDIMPTLLDLCGIESEIAFDGISLASHLRGEAVDLPSRSIVVQLQPDKPQKWHHCVVLRDKWRLVNGEELYDIASDPGQRNHVVGSYPDVVSAMREDYERLWEDLQTAFAHSVAIPVGTPCENPTLLSARDWHPTEGSVPWWQVWIDDPAHDSNGYWIVDFVQAGRYAVELRTHPREANLPMPAGRARLRIGESTWQRAIADGDCAASFTLDLPAGGTRLQTWLDDAAGGRRRGAYYVYATKAAK